MKKEEKKEPEATDKYLLPQVRENIEKSYMRKKIILIRNQIR